MNTLSRALTARIFPNSETYQALRNHWSDLINSERKHELTAAHQYSLFYEPDQHLGFTAACTQPVAAAHRRFFRRLVLWGTG